MVLLPAHHRHPAHPTHTRAAQVKGYPTLKVIHKGEEIKSYRGPRDKDSLKSFIEEAAKEVTTEA